MLYYCGYSVSFQEVPDEISLVILVTDCAYRCAGCHSPYMQKPSGDNLLRDLQSLISEYADAITCVCLMGDGRDKEAVSKCAKIIHGLGYKAAIYSGCDEREGLLYALEFDYVKYGPYIAEYGGLDKPTTNQHMIHVTKRFPDGIDFEDITAKFRKTY